MTTIVSDLFKVNGVIDTGKTVVQNLQTICAASGCWLTYDIAQGKWAVAINTTGVSIASFNDTNIIGGINISSTGLTELYNSVEIEFPHKDIKDRKDYITFSIADGSRYPNEPDNVLQLQTDLVNDPIQAAYIASRELKQSRVDKVIEFRTDFSKLGLKAGDLIDITNTPYGYTSKIFRIVSITEDDADDGVLSLSIQALEYDADVYSTTGLERDDRFTDTGIVTKDKNIATTGSDNASSTTAVANALSDPTNAALIATLMAALTRQGSNPGLVPVCDVFQVNGISLTADNTYRTINLGRTITVPYTGRYSINYNINWGSGIAVSPPLGMTKNSIIQLVVGGAVASLGEFAGTGDTYVQVFEDHNLTGLFTATKGQSLNYQFQYRSNLSPGSYTTPTGYPSFTVPAGTVVAVWIVATLSYLGT